MKLLLSINLGQLPPEVQSRAAARLKKWPLAALRHVARLAAAANQEKITITQALSGDDNRRQRSLASVKRQRERARMREEQSRSNKFVMWLSLIILLLESWPIEWPNGLQML